MLPKAFDVLARLSWFQKGFLIIAVLGLGGYGLLHTGLFNTPVKAKDCSNVPKAENAVVIKMENNNFDPKELTVNVCDTLVFLNLDDEPKWPAAGPHPTHSSYPGFDAGHALAKFDFFEFQVTRPGTYSFHDHLHEAVTGKITIKE